MYTPLCLFSGSPLNFPTTVSGDHLPNKQLAFKFMSQDLLLEELQIRYSISSGKPLLLWDAWDVGLLVLPLAEPNQNPGNLGDTVYGISLWENNRSAQRILAGGGGEEESGGNGVQQTEHNQHSTGRGRHASLSRFSDRILCGHRTVWAPRIY